MENKANNLLTFLSVLVLIIVISNMLITYIKIADFKEDVTGKVLSYVNLSITSYIILNLSQDLIDWGPGTINSGYQNSTLYTRGNSMGIVLRGNWSGENAKALVVTNIGNMNSSLYIKTGKDAHDLFESLSSSNEEYMINVSNKDPGSCSGGAALGVWTNVDKSLDGTKYCSQFSSSPDSNEVYIDILLTVPRDSIKIGNLSDTITIVASP